MEEDGMKVEHRKSCHFQDIKPSGYLFVSHKPTNEVIFYYYHDEIAINHEIIDSNGGTVSVSTEIIRVQDAAVHVPYDDFVGLIKTNLQTLEAESPGILERHGIKLAGHGE